MSTPTNAQLIADLTAMISAGDDFFTMYGTLSNETTTQAMVTIYNYMSELENYYGSGADAGQVPSNVQSLYQSVVASLTTVYHGIQGGETGTQIQAQVNAIEGTIIPELVGANTDCLSAVLGAVQSAMSTFLADYMAQPGGPTNQNTIIAGKNALWENLIVPLYSFFQTQAASRGMTNLANAFGINPKQFSLLYNPPSGGFLDMVYNGTKEATAGYYGNPPVAPTLSVMQALNTSVNILSSLVEPYTPPSGGTT